MPFLLSTERLRLRPFATDDVERYRAMITERGEPMPSADEARAGIARQHTVTGRRCRTRSLACAP